MNRILYIISMVTISLALVIMTTLIYWFAWPYKVIVPNEPYKVLTKEVVSGGQLTYLIDACKKKNVEARLSIAFIDGTVYYLPDVIYSNFPVGCAQRTRTIAVPHNLPTGEYHLQLTLVYQVNPIRKITTVIETEPFLIK